MQRNQSVLARAAGFVPFLLCIVIGLAVFAPVLPIFSAQLAPDSMPYFRVHYPWLQLEDVLARGESAPLSILYWFLLPPLVAHEATYLVDSLLVAAACALYLRGRGVRPALAWLGGAALGFSGYSFTLVSAGHRGYFHMMACTVFAFPLIERVFRVQAPISRKWPLYALLGFSLGWGALTQPDVFTLVVALAAAYALWLTFRGADCASQTPYEPRLARIRRVWPFFFVSLAAFALAGGGIVRALTTRFIPDRLLQIERDTAIAAAANPSRQETEDAAAEAAADNGASADAEAAAEAERKKAFDNWIFATNWSLPPEDALEFVAPCVRGIETADYPPGRQYPYWGRLGRSYEWEKTHAGFVNFRQHTVYLGAIQVFFALFAILAWIRARRSGRRPEWLRDVPFWAAAGIVALVLSFGRYTPVYRLFYAIPGMNLLRAPVKLHHLTEICTAFLFGLGLATAFQTAPDAASESVPSPGAGPTPGRPAAGRTAPAPDRTDSGRSGRTVAAPGIMGSLPALLLALVPGVALVVAAAAVKGAPAGLVATWKALGFPDAAMQPFASRMAGALLHGGLLWLCGGTILLLARRKGFLASAGIALAWLLVGGDLVAVARNYINAYDVSAIYRPNALTSRILGDASIPYPSVANLVTDPLGEHDQLILGLTTCGIEVAMRPSFQRPAAMRLASRPATFWDFAGVNYVFAPDAALRQLPLAKFAPVERIDAGALLGAGRKFPATLLRRRDPVPFAAFLPSWREVAGDAQLDAIARPGWDPLADPIVDAPPPDSAARAAASSAKAEVKAVRLIREPSLDTVIKTSNTSQGMLAVRQYFDLPVEALVDGEKTPVHRMNAIWSAVPVPAGDHTVVVRRVRNGSVPLFLGMAGLVAFLATLAFQARAGFASHRQACGNLRSYRVARRQSCSRPGT